MKKLMGAVVVLGACGLGVVPVYSDEGPKARPEIRIENHDEHNQRMDQCIKTALEKHPGGVIEVEFEQEEDQSKFEVEIKGKDGKKWEVECNAVSGDVIEDKEKKKDKKDKKDKDANISEYYKTRSLSLEQ